MNILRAVSHGSGWRSPGTWIERHPDAIAVARGTARRQEPGFRTSTGGATAAGGGKQPRAGINALILLRLRPTEGPGAGDGAASGRGRKALCGPSASSLVLCRGARARGRCTDIAPSVPQKREAGGAEGETHGGEAAGAGRGRASGRNERGCGWGLAWLATGGPGPLNAGGIFGATSRTPC